MIGKLRAPLRTLLNTSDMLVVIIPYLHNLQVLCFIINSPNCSHMPIEFVVVFKAALHTKFFKSLFLKCVIKLLAA